MKNLFIAATLLLAGLSYAQTDGGFGIKGGLNYGSVGDFQDNFNNITENPDDRVGYHVGVFGKVDLGPIYFRPELIYTKLNSEYNAGDFEVKKLDAPILVGLEVLGPLHVFAGPSLQYILDTDFDTGAVNFDLRDAQDDFTVGLQFGVGVNLGNLGVDVRYERGLNENEARYANDMFDNVRIDTRPEQVIIALSLVL
ncbi:porin family protein [Nonlabens ponticola]|uniref:PorT family protein n=1 Tax=Nonlabens ponticola TaxID=2496866 RepID=A0A3S9MZ98_9FLAO|nr:porin family protein [Nonlabens ponticola]AZQ44586.1 PorT family protein [Nonlabens ponticola]